jgi:hypothetical protein
MFSIVIYITITTRGRHWGYLAEEEGWRAALHVNGTDGYPTTRHHVRLIMRKCLRHDSESYLDPSRDDIEKLFRHCIFQMLPIFLNYMSRMTAAMNLTCLLFRARGP